MAENNKFVIAKEVGLGLSETASYIETTDKSLVRADKENLFNNYLGIYKMAIEAGYDFIEAEELADCALYLAMTKYEADKIKELLKGDIDEIRQGKTNREND